MADNAPKYVVEIVGWDGTRVRSFAGEPSIRKLDCDPDIFQITEVTSPGPPKLVVSLRAEFASVIDDLIRDLAALTVRVATLEAKRFSVTPLKSASYTAVSWEHVLVDMDAAAGDVVIALPASPTINDRVRITDTSADGGYGGAHTLKVSGTFAAGSLGHWVISPHSVAYSAGLGGSLKGANIELVYVGTGWFVVAETCSVVELL